MRGSAVRVAALAVALTASIGAQQPRSSRIVTNLDALETVDTSARYLFYLHPKVVEDKGLPAASDEFGTYHYDAILQRLADFGFIVISEVRPKDASSTLYAGRVATQVRALLDAGVPASRITVVGASKGAYMAALVSHQVTAPGVGYVLLAICDAELVDYMIKQGTDLHGDVLALRDAADRKDLAGPCGPLFAFSRDIGTHREIVVNVGTGHAIVYQPLDEWVLPAVRWADGSERQSQR